jgi:ribonuclease T1
MILSLISMRIYLFKLMMLCLTILFAICCTHEPVSKQQNPDKAPEKTQQGKSEARKSNVPEYVMDVLAYVKQHGTAPDGYVGGRTFQNREKRLPEKDKEGQKIRYREWDVFPKIQGRNRGAERMVTSSDERAWYTRDHYRTFVEIDQ